MLDCVLQYSVSQFTGLELGMVRLGYKCVLQYSVSQFTGSELGIVRLG
jgi:hypothetical protein